MRTSNARPYADVPNRFRSMPPKREADETNCRGGISAEKCSSRYLSDLSHLNAKQINSSVGTTIGRPRNDGRFRYRKREIENKRFCPAGRRGAVPYMCYSTASIKYILDEKSGKRRTFSLYPVPENCCLSATPALISTLPFAV